VALDLTARPVFRSPTAPIRVPARSAIAGADVELARHTLAELHEETAFEATGGRVLERLRRLVVGDPEELNFRS
jgi:hypothetical protein